MSEEAKMQPQKPTDEQERLFEVDKLSQGFGIGVISAAGALLVISVAIHLLKMLGLKIDTGSIAIGAGFFTGNIIAILIVSEISILSYSLAKAVYDCSRKINANVERHKRWYFANAHKNAWYGIKQALTIALRSTVSIFRKN